MSVLRRPGKQGRGFPPLGGRSEHPPPPGVYGCQRRFTTYEIVESLPIIVVKRDGSRQGFDRNKILNSMIRAFDKRKVDVTDLDRITTEIEQTIQNTLEREISTDKIGEMVMERLKPLDEVAYIRFASIYHRFQDAGSFMREISKFLEEK